MPLSYVLLPHLSSRKVKERERTGSAPLLIKMVMS